LRLISHEMQTAGCFNSMAVGYVRSIKQMDLVLQNVRAYICAPFSQARPTNTVSSCL